jgi:hypothetical protein
MPSRQQIEIISSKLKEIKDLFDQYFDRPWLLSAMDRSELPQGFVREIRLFLDGKDFYFDEPLLIRDHMNKVDIFLGVIEGAVIPNLKDVLGISTFRDHTKDDKTGDTLTRKFINYTFPHNVRSFHDKFDELRKLLVDTYPTVFVL